MVYWVDDQLRGAEVVVYTFYKADMDEIAGVDLGKGILVVGHSGPIRTAVWLLAATSDSIFKRIFVHIRRWQFLLITPHEVASCPVATAR